MTTVVVLSAYNGEKYILEQLISLLKQTRQPNAVVIRDDCSTDKTVEIIKDFISCNDLINWRLEVNKKNEGWKKNFHDLIIAAQEDLIFPCDQDDMWHSTKIEEMATIMESHDEIDLLACGYEPLYEDNTRRITPNILKGMNNSKKIEKVQLNEKYMHVLRPGCSFVLRKSFCQLISSEWDVTLPHDSMVWRTAIIKGTAFIYQHNLITWRRYSTSSSNPSRNIRKNENRFKLLLEERTNSNISHLLYIECLFRLVKHNKLDINNRVKSMLKTSYIFETRQREALLSHNLLRVFIVDFKYRMFLLSYKTILSDMYIAFRSC